MILRLQEKYKKEVVPALSKKFGYDNIMAVPKIKKVVVNSCFGKKIIDKDSKDQEKIKKTVVEDLTLITGQKPKIVKSKKAVSGFSLKEGLEIAAVVTLRRKKMYDFLERLIYLALPRLRDFQGIPEKSIDEKGNLTIGFKEHIAFPEVFTEKEKAIFGLEITVVTDTENKEEGIDYTIYQTHKGKFLLHVYDWSRWKNKNSHSRYQIYESLEEIEEAPDKLITEAKVELGEEPVEYLDI